MWNFEGNYGEDEDESDHHSWGSKDSVLIVIDACSEMFENNSNENCKMMKILNAVEALTLNRIISNSKDLIGIVVYNTVNSPPPIMQDDELEISLTVPKNCAILLPLKVISANTIRYLKNMKESLDFFNFSEKYGHSSDTKIADVLWLCCSIFANNDPKKGTHTIMWFTANDAPHEAGSSDFTEALIKANDLQMLNIDFKLIPMSETFDCEQFYKEFICRILNEELDEVVLPKAVYNDETLLKRMFRRDYRKRMLANLTINLGNNVEIGTGVYIFTRKLTKPTPIKLLRANKEVVESKRIYKFGAYDPDPNNIEYNEQLTANKQLKVATVAGRTVSFSPIEVFEMKQIFNPGIKLLGFKPKSKILNVHNHIHSPYFLYPNDKTIKNSSTCFRALWQKCLEMDKVAICIFTLRAKTYPRLVALVPQEYVESSDGEVLRHDGFRMEVIPYASEIRDLSSKMIVPDTEINDSAKEAFRKIIKKLRFNYHPSLFENPTIRNLYTNLEAIEFDTKVEEFEDSTLPNIDIQDEKITPFVNILVSLFGKMDLEKNDSKRPLKSTGESAAKKHKTELSPVEIYRLVMTDENSKQLTATNLKACLNSLGVKGLSKMSKQTMIEKLKSMEFTNQMGNQK